MGCTVCEEWLNYSNFKVWYDQNRIKGMALDLDKDILFKGNKVYSPETCCFVPHAINTLFLNGKKNRGDLPLGVHFDKSKGRNYCNSAIPHIQYIPYIAAVFCEISHCNNDVSYHAI